MNIKTLNRIKDLTQELKHCCTGRNYRHLSFLVWRNKILSVGFNSSNIHPKVQKMNIYNNYADGSEKGLHSEASALIVNYKGDIADLKYCTLVNTRISKTGQFGMSCPCISCQQLISFCGIKRVLFTNSQGEWEKF
jgi:deoxycytidylate deaminase